MNLGLPSCWGVIKGDNSESPSGISERTLVDTFPLVCLTPLLWGSDQRQQFGSTGQSRSTGKPGGQRDWVHRHAHNARAWENKNQRFLELKRLTWRCCDSEINTILHLLKCGLVEPPHVHQGRWLASRLTTLDQVMVPTLTRSPRYCKRVWMKEVFYQHMIYCHSRFPLIIFYVSASVNKIKHYSAS